MATALEPAGRMRCQAWWTGFGVRPEREFGESSNPDRARGTEGGVTGMHDDDPKLPDALQRDLRAAFGAQVRVPAAVAAALAAAARRRRLVPVWRRPVLLAAAALLLALPLVALLWRGTARSEPPLAREDFDRNGRVDVLDAFRLSLALRRGDSVPPELDLDGDGKVDARDVDRIAAVAVKVHG